MTKITNANDVLEFINQVYGYTGENIPSIQMKTQPDANKRYRFKLWETLHTRWMRLGELEDALEEARRSLAKDRSKDGKAKKLVLAHMFHGLDVMTNVQNDIDLPGVEYLLEKCLTVAHMGIHTDFHVTASETPSVELRAGLQLIASTSEYTHFDALLIDVDKTAKANDHLGYLAGRLRKEVLKVKASMETQPDHDKDELTLLRELRDAVLNEKRLDAGLIPMDLKLKAGFARDALRVGR